MLFNEVIATNVVKGDVVLFTQPVYETRIVESARWHHASMMDGEYFKITFNDGRTYICGGNSTQPLLVWSP